MFFIGNPDLYWFNNFYEAIKKDMYPSLNLKPVPPMFLHKAFVVQSS